MKYNTTAATATLSTAAKSATRASKTHAANMPTAPGKARVLGRFSVPWLRLGVMVEHDHCDPELLAHEDPKKLEILIGDMVTDFAAGLAASMEPAGADLAQRLRAFDRIKGRCGYTRPVVFTIREESWQRVCDLADRLGVSGKAVVRLAFAVKTEEVLSDRQKLSDLTHYGMELR